MVGDLSGRDRECTQPDAGKLEIHEIPDLFHRTDLHLGREGLHELGAVEAGPRRQNEPRLPQQARVADERDVNPYLRASSGNLRTERSVTMLSAVRI